MAAFDAADLPDDEEFREAIRSHVEFGSQVARQNSHAESDDQLHPFARFPDGPGPMTTRMSEAALCPAQHPEFSRAHAHV